MVYKQPRSVQVVVFALGGGKREYLLLRRVASHGGFWQSVTGSLEDNETHREAAIREVREETGVVADQAELIDLNLTNNFAIAPQWLGRYAPGVTHNEEVCFALQVQNRDVVLDPSEHDSYIWVDYQTATGLLYWESSKRAFALLESTLDQSCKAEAPSGADIT
jgi:dATP pyrophosphohydrolase